MTDQVRAAMDIAHEIAETLCRVTETPDALNQNWLAWRLLDLIDARIGEHAKYAKEDGGDR